MVVSMLSCGALERSNNPYIESIVEPCVSKKRDLCHVGLIVKEILKNAEPMEKRIHEQKAELVYLCVREKKNNSFEITVMILRYIRNVNFSNSRKILELQNFY